MPTVDDSGTIMDIATGKGSRKCFPLQGMWLPWNSENAVRTDCQK